jgi:hypothetical protein
MNELILKKIVAKPRPVGSCNISCGMPSSHATLAVGYCTWILLEIIFHQEGTNAAEVYNTLTHCTPRSLTHCI